MLSRWWLKIVDYFQLISLNCNLYDLLTGTKLIFNSFSQLIYTKTINIKFNILVRSKQYKDQGLYEEINSILIDSWPYFPEQLYLVE